MKHGYSLVKMPWWNRKFDIFTLIVLCILIGVGSISVPIVATYLGSVITTLIIIGIVVLLDPLIYFLHRVTTANDYYNDNESTPD